MAQQQDRLEGRLVRRICRVISAMRSRRVTTTVGVSSDADLVRLVRSANRLLVNVQSVVGNVGRRLYVRAPGNRKKHSTVVTMNNLLVKECENPTLQQESARQLSPFCINNVLLKGDRTYQSRARGMLRLRQSRNIQASTLLR